MLAGCYQAQGVRGRGLGIHVGMGAMLRGEVFGLLLKGEDGPRQFAGHVLQPVVKGGGSNSAPCALYCSG